VRVDDGNGDVDEQDSDTLSIEEEDAQVTDDDLHQIEEQRLLDEGENSIPEGLGYGIDDSIERLGDMSQHDVYLTLLHFCKSICSCAAQDLTLARRTMLSFRDIRNGIYAKSNERHEITELQAVIGRPKGRPRKSQIARRVAAGLPVGRNHCQICEGEHDLKECPHLPGLSDIREENSRLDAENKRRRCRVCLGFGHNAKTCPHRRRLSPHERQTDDQTS
jgi:hypothetical protein